MMGSQENGTDIVTGELQGKGEMDTIATSGTLFARKEGPQA